MPRLLRPAQYLRPKGERYLLPPEVKRQKKDADEFVRDFRIPLAGHVPGTPLPPLDQDPRLNTRVKRQRMTVRAPDIPKSILREGATNPLGARLPALLPDEDSPLAQKIWLPNLRIFLIRNGPAHAGDPYTATFRVPRDLNKIDIAQYLRQVYGVGINGIRTVVQYADLIKQPGRYKSVVRKPILKKAIVQLDEPFLYPKEHNPYYLQKHFQYPLYGMRTKEAAILSPEEDMSYPAYKERQGREAQEAEADVQRRMSKHRASHWRRKAGIGADEEEEQLADEDIAEAEQVALNAARAEFHKPSLPRAEPVSWRRRLAPFDRSKIPRAHQPPRRTA